MNFPTQIEYYLSRLRFSSIIRFFILLFGVVSCDAKVDFSVPLPKAEVLSPTGFRISIPDQRGMAFFAFHGNINREITATENGQFSGDTRQAERNEWAYETTRYQLQPGDILYFWLYVQHDSLGYVLSNQRLVYPHDFTTRLAGSGISYQTNSAQTTPSYTYQSTTEYYAPTTQRTTRRTTQRTTRRTTPKTTTNAYNSDHSQNNRPISPSYSTYCEPSITTVNKVPVACRNELLFAEQFEGDIYNKWAQDIQMPSDSEDVEFVVYENYYNVWNVSNGNLNIYPQLLSESPNWSSDGIETGSFDISSDRCTGIHNVQQECHRTASFFSILPPVVSAKFRTSKSFNFKYGKVEIRAKLPKGDWMFPEIYLEPNETAYGFSPYANGLLRIAFIRGNEYLMNKNVPIGGNILSGGVIVGEVVRETGQRTTIGREHYGNRFHRYGITWTDKSITFTVDDVDYGINTGQFKNLMGVSNAAQWQRGNSMAPFDREFYISLGVGVGGRADFPDGSRTSNGHQKPWENTDPKMELNFWLDRENWLPTWNGHDSGLIVDYVKVWSV